MLLNVFEEDTIVKEQHDALSLDGTGEVTVVTNSITKYSHVCQHCKKAFERADYLQQHLLTHGDSPFKCRVCGKGFSLEGSVKVHERIHTGDKPYECEVCGKGFNQKGNLKVHMRTHTGERPYECSHCGERFTQLANLQVHERIHTGDTPYGCEQCGAAFRQLSSLRSHRKVHFSGGTPHRKHNSEPDTPVKKKPETLIVKIVHTKKGDKETETKRIRFKCEHCDLTFPSRFALNRHTANRHSASAS